MPYPMLKSSVVRATPRASATTAAAVRPGCLTNRRTAIRQPPNENMAALQEDTRPALWIRREIAAGFLAVGSSVLPRFVLQAYCAQAIAVGCDR
jgi:hypothetical protein